jgi:hypothetical protein
MQGTAGIAAYLARHHALTTPQNVRPRPIEPHPSWL